MVGKRMKAALVIHAPMSVLGGAELVNLHTMKLLQESCYEITLLSDSWSSLPLVERFGMALDGIKWKPIEISKFVPRMPVASGYQRISFMLRRQAEIDHVVGNKTDYDLVIDTFSGWDLPSGIRGRKMIYFHEIPILGHPRGPLWGAYYALGDLVFRRHMSKIQGSQAVCNSSYTSKLLLAAYGIDGRVVYPPVNAEFFSQVAEHEPRENRFVVLSRFCREKKLHEAIEVLRKLISRVPDAKATIIGAVTSSDVLEELRQMSSLYGVGNNVSFAPNLDMRSVREVLSASKVVFSTMPNEPFGIGIVEGMAAGCVPLVHKGGGQYDDVIDHDRYGLSYNDQEEAVALMESIMLGDQKRSELKRAAVSRALQFSVNRFREEFKESIGE
jgi:alpha-1,2-mannosyltransferase